ncbi:hypothetical protein FRC12_006017 [Ceratobasidium sp. 428]|nr:hypothetical protein FRC12_006017 [Ceratobasidium sp. 428]
MKINSEVFRDMFALPSGNDDSNPEGASKERPISIPGVTSGEFRSLMTMIYCSPSDKLFLDMQARNKSRSGSFQNFTFYSDVARLANRFCMTDIENWATNQLRSLMCTSASCISNGARDQTKDGIPIIFTLTLQYARVIADTVLEHNVQNLNQRYCITPGSLSAPVLLGLLHGPQLRQQNPSMFGFLFVALLNLGHSVWMKEPFTREDRVAFFSAQSFLTPLPESLGKDLAAPLLARPRLTKDGYLEVFENKDCSGECHRRLSRAWNVIFGSTYYKDVASRKALKATARLERLPYRRLEFASIIRTYSACNGDCSSKALGCLDEGIHQLFVRLGGYYQSID